LRHEGDGAVEEVVPRLVLERLEEAVANRVREEPESPQHYTGNKPSFSFSYQLEETPGLAKAWSGQGVTTHHIRCTKGLDI